MNIAEKVRLRKHAHPEWYCRVPGCLWRTVNANTGERTPCARHDPTGAKERPRG